MDLWNKDNTQKKKIKYIEWKSGFKISIKIKKIQIFFTQKEKTDIDLYNLLEKDQKEEFE